MKLGQQLVACCSSTASVSYSFYLDVVVVVVVVIATGVAVVVFKRKRKIPHVKMPLFRIFFIKLTSKKKNQQNLNSQINCVCVVKSSK